MSDEIKGKVIPVSIEDEVKNSFLNYAMSVIVARALPDVRDGLKPIHRRILYSMNEMGVRSNQATKKAARIVGDIMGKYHPHGDASIYDALVRLAQNFSMRYCMVQGQGNFGSIDGDPPAAMRYTEARMTRLAEEMVKDIGKETVDFVPNYDDSMQEPSVLPAALPYLLVNGSVGIAVGMATNMPPHNLGEVCSAIAAYIDDPNIDIKGLMKHVTGPDFPTAGIIFGRRGILDAYTTGRGRISVRARFVIESTKSGRDMIVVTELPYLVNRKELIKRIADLVKEKNLDGISDLNDESDQNGTRIVIELKKDVSPKIILNYLFTHTQLQANFNVNNLALVGGKPKTLSLKEMIGHFVAHRREVVIRRAKYELRKAEERAHILEGLKIALDNIDEVIAIIKASGDVDIARKSLMERFALSEIQAQAILDMRLQRLTSLEIKKIIEELQATLALIAELKAFLASEEKILGLVKTETLELAAQYGDGRRTEIVAEEIEEFNIEDLIQKEDMVVLISNRGFIKRLPFTVYKVQTRGGKGSSATVLKDEDFINKIFIASTHDYMLFITSEGKAYFLKVHEVPEASRASRGQHIKALLSISANEEIAAVVSLPAFTDDTFIFFATRKGVVKKVRTSDFSNARTRGIAAIRLDAGDKVVGALLTRGKDDIMLLTRRGLGLRFTEEVVRFMGRASRGIKGLKLLGGDELACAVAVNPEERLFVVTEYGYGKRVEYANFQPHGRGGKGVITYKTTEKTGEIAGALSVTEDAEIVVITSQGNAIKLKVSQISTQGKAAQGVRIVNIDQPDFVVGVDKAEKEEDE
ncbi:MAG: DNA topoisomerase (ATP-hydrolyzing) subunit A [Spirochaetia bacterium]|nr:DNA topoisomerase (ATP-hydrolyzing) subunit A [Spirochaetia bacterium]